MSPLDFDCGWRGPLDEDMERFRNDLQKFGVSSDLGNADLVTGLHDRLIRFGDEELKELSTDKSYAWWTPLISLIRAELLKISCSKEGADKAKSKIEEVFKNLSKELPKLPVAETDLLQETVPGVTRVLTSRLVGAGTNDNTRSLEETGFDVIRDDCSEIRSQTADEIVEYFREDPTLLLDIHERFDIGSVSRQMINKHFTTINENVRTIYDHGQNIFTAGDKLRKYLPALEEKICDVQSLAGVSSRAQRRSKDLQDEVDGLKARLKKSSVITASEDAEELEQLKEVLESFRSRNNVLTEKNRIAEQARSKALEQLYTANSNFHAIQGDNQRLNGKVTEIEEQMSQEQETNATLRQDATRLQDENSKLKTELASRKSQCNILAGENTSRARVYGDCLRLSTSILHQLQTYDEAIGGRPCDTEVTLQAVPDTDKLSHNLAVLSMGTANMLLKMNDLNDTNMSLNKSIGLYRKLSSAFVSNVAAFEEIVFSASSLIEAATERSEDDQSVALAPLLISPMPQQPDGFSIFNLLRPSNSEPLGSSIFNLAGLERLRVWVNSFQGMDGVVVQALTYTYVSIMLNGAISTNPSIGLAETMSLLRAFELASTIGLRFSRHTECLTLMSQIQKIAIQEGPLIKGYLSYLIDLLELTSPRSLDDHVLEAASISPGVVTMQQYKVSSDEDKLILCCPCSSLVILDKSQVCLDFSAELDVRLVLTDCPLLGTFKSSWWHYGDRDSIKTIGVVLERFFWTFSHIIASEC